MTKAQKKSLEQKVTKKNNLRKLLKIAVILGFVGFVVVASIIFYLVNKNIKNLPDYEQLRHYTPIITTRLYAQDGALIGEYSKEKRIFVPIELIPDELKNAFIAAEDSNFYQNSGIDIIAIFRTAFKNFVNIFTKTHGMGGASTITQQVVKNFLLTRERTIERKIKEAILAYRITQAFEKDKILELYLNQIYLGSGAYGVAAAAEVYFDKSIDELHVEEFALLATLPKAPSKLDPRKNIEKAKYRRNWVINRMVDENFISKQEGEEAKAKPIKLKLERDDGDFTKAHFFADSVKKNLTKLYGSDDVFENGIFVRTTLDSRLQKIANKSFSQGIENYDKKHGYRGALGKISLENKDLQEVIDELNDFKVTKLHKKTWQKAVVMSIDKDYAMINTQDSESGLISLKSLKWARKFVTRERLGKAIEKIEDALNIGDIIMVEKVGESEFELRQIPEVNGAFLAMDPHSGRILAMMGGYIDSPNQFNRATQALRQPGSTMKSFGYLAALENSMTPATIMIDEPISLDQGDDLPPYNPTNYSGEFYGPTTLRIGLEKSRNVTTVRMADEVGLDKIVEVVKRFKINDDPKYIHSLVLGSTETTLTRLVSAYSMMINGGKEVLPSMIEKIQDRNGKTIYKRDKRNCEQCLIQEINAATPPKLLDLRKQITDEATSYQLSYMLQGTVERGTGRKARAIGKIVGGKTGTTNNSYDSWFVGFTPDLIVGVYVGFDIPKTLGARETGASIALPIFVDFMKEALKDTPSTPFRVPQSVKFVKIDRKTGKFPTPKTPRQNILFEAFKDSDDTNSILSQSIFDKISDGFGSNEQDQDGESVSSGGIY